MKTTWFLLVVLIFTINKERLLGQNLVPNPGFDNVTDCPSVKGQIELAYPWVKSSNSPIEPTLYNSCSNELGLKVPHAGFHLNSYQEARSGQGYTSLMVYSNHEGIVLQILPYIGVPLTQKMEMGMEYFIEFYVSPDIGSTWVHTDAVGMALTDSSYYEVLELPNQVLSLSPAIENLGTLITDSVGWTRVCGTHISSGTEGFAVIGNFRTADQTLIERENIRIANYSSHFYIEDVLITPFDPLPDTIILCLEDSIILNASFLDAEYLWNIGVEDSIIEVREAGVYTVELFMGNCVLTDTVVVIDAGQEIDFPSDTTICNDQHIILDVGLPGDYLWSDGSTDKRREIVDPGIYSVTVTSRCVERFFDTYVDVTECDCPIFVPTAFSPNNDGINDQLEVFINCDYEYNFKRFEVYDRWGNQLYTQNNDDLISWDGESNNSVLTNGVYVWMLEYELLVNGQMETKVLSGDVTIVK